MDDRTEEYFALDCIFAQDLRSMLAFSIEVPNLISKISLELSEDPLKIGIAIRAAEDAAGI